ncbi:helix-turn-helix domain-containing protein [Agrobacterium rosae]|uniref:helix-turn-helix domain-containing protein n=1 Tax=Agrobacterium rosae TaxID=1972867 RepID=UPI00203461C4|nr:helix-turn-helix transcriptional regulator [Agrobacterium rosae]MCM2435831.1 helix-turn-helix transcriptional regulator [Agrobacterium rosae]
MNNNELAAWRKTVALTQQQAADAMGIALATYENYERGERRDNGQPVVIPSYIELACDGLSLRLAAKDNDVHRLTRSVRTNASHVMYLLSLASWIAGGKRKEGRMYPTHHALLRDEGMIPKDEPSLLEKLFPMADANRLRDLMVHYGLQNAPPTVAHHQQAVETVE